MFESLSIHYLCFVILQRSNFYCAGTIYLHNDIWTFPFRE
jgi:hypothetical protein